MALSASWFLIILGVFHLLVGAITFKADLVNVFKSGLINQFSATETRRLIFWFLIAGLFVILIGCAGLHAAAISDVYFFKITGINLLIISIFGVLAVPKSPFWGLLIASALFIVYGYGVLK